MSHNEAMGSVLSRIQNPAKTEDTNPPAWRKNEDTERTDALMLEGVSLFSSTCSGIPDMPTDR